MNESLEKIWNWCFTDTQLEQLTIPASVTHIGDWVFYDCSRLTRITFAENSKLESISCVLGLGRNVTVYVRPGMALDIETYLSEVTVVRLRQPGRRAANLRLTNAAE